MKNATRTLIIRRSTPLTLAALLAASIAAPSFAQTTAPAMQTAQVTQSAPAVAVTAPRRTERVMVLPFTGPQTWREGHWLTVGTQLANMVTTALLNKGVSVVDRATLTQQQKEMELDLTGAANGATMAQFGKTAGAKIMITGSVSEFGVENKTINLGFVKQTKSTARVKIDVRLIDVETSEVIAAATGEGTETKKGLGVNIIVNFNSNNNEWLESMLGKAARTAVEEMAAKLAPQVPLRSEEPKKRDDDAAVRPISDATPGIAQLRGMTCVVLIPETHLGRPRIPDPAAETEITKQLLNAGIPVKDDQRLKQLRDEKWVLESLRGQSDPVKLQELKNNFGADILIVGEAISERTEKNVLQSDAVICRGRIELKAIRMDTGNIVAADDAHEAGRDLSEIISSKNALKRAASSVAPRFITAMARNLAHGAASDKVNSVTVELEISGFGSLSEANQFVNAVGKLPKVQNAKRGKWLEGGVIFAKVEIEKDAAEDLGIWLEENDSLKKFGVKVQGSSATKVSGAVKKG